MRVCRVSKFWPSEDGSISGGLHAFNITRVIGVPTLVITSRFDRALQRAHPACQIVQVRYPGRREHPGAGESALRLGWRKLCEIEGFLVHGVAAAMRYRPNLVHIHSPTHLPLALAVKARIGSPIVVTLHGTDVHHLERFPGLRRVLRFADRVLCISPHMVPLARSVLPAGRVHSIGNGVDLDLFRDRGLARDKRIVTVAAFKWSKGHEYLISALPAVFASHPDARCLLVGDGSARPRIERMVAEKGLSDRVDFVRHLDRFAVAEAFASSCAMVLPSVSEGLPGVLLEAMACGTPSITTDAGCCAEVAGRAAIVVPKRDSAAIARGLVRLLSDEELGQRLSQRGRELAKRYSWEAVGARVLDVYQELMVSASSKPVVRHAAADLGDDPKHNVTARRETK